MKSISLSKIDDRRQTERPIYVVYHEALRETTGRWGGHSAGACSTSRSLRCTARRGEGDVEIPPCSPRGSSGYWLDARLGPVGLAGVPQQRRRNSGAKVDGTIGIIIEVWHDLSFFPYNSPKPWLIIYIYHSHSTHQQRRLHAAAQHAYGTMQAIEVRGTSQYFFLSIHDED